MPKSKSEALKRKIAGKMGEHDKRAGFSHKSLMKDLVRAGFGGVKTSSLKGKSVYESSK